MRRLRAVPEAGSVQDNVTRNVRAVMAHRRLYRQKDLADLLGWDPSMLTRRFQGSWQLTDLDPLARALKVRVDDLVRDPGRPGSGPQGNVTADSRCTQPRGLTVLARPILERLTAADDLRYVHAA